jgi:GT2 family glycosyltransferase
MIELSIVIINYNTFGLTCQCIDSIVEQTQDVRHEIIVVDNASCERDPQDFAARYPFIKLVKSEKNVGFAGGNNLGIAVAEGQYIVLLNSDTVLQNNVMHICLDYLRTHPRVAVVGPALFFDDGTRQHNCQRFPSIRYKLFELFRLQKFLPRRTGGKILLGYFFDHTEPVETDWIWGTCFMFEKKLLLELKDSKLAETFFMYGEDMQWCLEFKKLGYHIAYEPAARVLHLMGKSGGAKSDLIEKNAAIFMNMYYSPAERFVIRQLDRLLIP